MARSSSRPSPFKRSIRALTPEPPAGSNESAATPAPDPNAVPQASASVPAPSGPVVRTPTTSGATTRLGVPVVAGEAVSTRRPMAGPGPMSFQPLQDDSLRKGRKFLGLHKGLLTTPGRAAGQLARTYSKPLLILLVVAAIGVGGYLGVTELQKYFSSEEAKKRAARDQAIASQSWEELTNYAKEYGPDAAKDGDVRDALSAAFQARVDEIVDGGVKALEAGDPDAWSRAEQQIGNLTTAWTELTGDDQLPDELSAAVQTHVLRFRREALVQLQNGVRAAAMNAESTITNGEIRAGMDSWSQSKASWEQLAVALEVPADDLPRFHETIRESHRGVLRAAFNALQAQLRQQYDGALVGVTSDPAALAEFQALRAQILDQARDYGLSEQDLMDLGRDADRYTDEIGRKVQVQLDQELQAAGATATQEIASPDVSLRSAIENWRLAADSVMGKMQTIGINDDNAARLMEQRHRIEQDLLRRVVKAARQTADVEELKGLRELYLETPEALSEIDKLITAALIQQGNFDGAEEFSTGSARILATFGAAMHDYWVKREPAAAASRFGQIFADESMDQIRESGELDNLLAIAGAWQMVIANADRNRRAVREALTSVVRITPEIDSPTWAHETFSIAWFQMLRDDFSGASLLLQRLPGKLPEGYPLDYLTTVANVRAGKTSLTDNLLRTRETIAEQDLNKLYLLRYVTEVQEKAHVYDARAMRAIDQLIETGQLEPLAAALGRDAGMDLDPSAVRFTVGAVRYFYYYQRTGGFTQMRGVQAQPYQRAADLLHQLHSAVFGDGTPSVETTRARLDALDQALPTGAGKWPLELVRGMILFQKAYQLDDRSAYRSAATAFERAAELHPVLEPVSLIYRGRLALFQGNPSAAEVMFRRALDKVPASAEARRYLADAVSAEDEGLRRDLLLSAAGQGNGVSVPFPGAVYELADPFNDLKVNKAYWRGKYADWRNVADDIARNEFPRVPAEANNRRESEDSGSGPDGSGDDQPPGDSDETPTPDEHPSGRESEDSSFGDRESEPVNGVEDVDDEVSAYTRAMRLADLRRIADRNRTHFDENAKRRAFERSPEMRKFREAASGRPLEYRYSPLH